MAENLIQMQHVSKEPAGFTSQGESFISDEHGIIGIPSQFVEAAKVHGFTAEVAERLPVKPLRKVEEEEKPVLKIKGAKGGE